MTPETLFSIANVTVLPAWLLLAAAPHWRWTARLVCGVVVPLLLASLYTFLVLTRFGASEGGFGSLGAVATLFSDESLLLAGWIHYLAFDLFVGAWEVRDARSLGIPHLLVVPCLLLTFLFGPAGLLAYMVLRWALRRRLEIGPPIDV